jgi:hypothetical protein
MEIQVEFEWFRDLSGYELLEAVAPPPPAPELIKYPYTGQMMMMEPGPLTQDLGSPQRIVRRGGALERYRPLDRFSKLAAVFANIQKTPDGALDFVKNFGLLTKAGLDNKEQGDSVPYIIERASVMYSWLCENNVRKYVIENPLTLLRVDLCLVSDPISNEPVLRISPNSLIDALWLQLGQIKSGGGEIRTCAQCGNLFQSGPGTTRRKGAKFCSDEHRVTYNSLKRSNP